MCVKPGAGCFWEVPTLSDLLHWTTLLSPTELRRGSTPVRAARGRGWAVTLQVALSLLQSCTSSSISHKARVRAEHVCTPQPGAGLQGPFAWSWPGTYLLGRSQSTGVWTSSFAPLFCSGTDFLHILLLQTLTLDRLAQRRMIPLKMTVVSHWIYSEPLVESTFCFTG